MSTFTHEKAEGFLDALGEQNAATKTAFLKAKAKKKWSKGKVKDKAQHAVVLDKTTYDRILKEVPTFRLQTWIVSFAGVTTNPPPRRSGSIW